MKAIFYATSTGNTEVIANKILEKTNGFELIDISRDGLDKMSECESMIIGVPTWGEGDLQDDWEDCLGDLQAIDFSNKTVALFGLGDQDGYPEEFVNALGIMYEEITSLGGKTIGYTSTEGYDYEESKAEIDGEFVGLVIDEDNQAELTDDRIDNWFKSIEGSL